MNINNNYIKLSKNNFGMKKDSKDDKSNVPVQNDKVSYNQEFTVKKHPFSVVNSAITAFTTLGLAVKFKELFPIALSTVMYTSLAIKDYNKPLVLVKKDNETKEQTLKKELLFKTLVTTTIPLLVDSFIDHKNQSKKVRYLSLLGATIVNLSSGLINRKLILDKFKQENI